MAVWRRKVPEGKVLGAGSGVELEGLWPCGQTGQAARESAMHWVRNAVRTHLMLRSAASQTDHKRHEAQGHTGTHKHRPTRCYKPQIVVHVSVSIII